MNDDRPHTLTLPNGREVRTRLEWTEASTRPEWRWATPGSYGTLYRTSTGDWYVWVAPEEVTFDEFLAIADDLSRIREAMKEAHDDE